MTGLSRPVKVPDVVRARHARAREGGVPGSLIVEEFEAFRIRLLDAARRPVEPAGGLLVALDLRRGRGPAVRLHPCDVSRRLRRCGGCHGYQRHDCPTGESKSSAKRSHYVPHPGCHRRKLSATFVPPGATHRKITMEQFVAPEGRLWIRRFTLRNLPIWHGALRQIGLPI